MYQGRVGGGWCIYQSGCNIPLASGYAIWSVEINVDAGSCEGVITGCRGNQISRDVCQLDCNLYVDVLLDCRACNDANEVMVGTH